MTKKTRKIDSVLIDLYGKKVAAMIELEMPIYTGKIFNVPLATEFNSNWLIRFNCLSCLAITSFGQDYEHNIATFDAINKPTKEQIELLASVFYDLTVYNDGNELYLNRRSFDYEFDMQRRSNITPIQFACSVYNAPYICDLTIGSPQLPDRGNPYGALGIIRLHEILMMRHI